MKQISQYLAAAQQQLAQVLGLPVSTASIEAQSLLRAVLPTVLHVVIAIGTGYAVGSEFSRRSRRAWLRCAGGSPLAALVGKLMPLFGIYLLLMVVLLAIWFIQYSLAWASSRYGF